MKTHLPKGLRAALMAALASVSLTAAYGASAIDENTDWAITWPPKTTPDRTVNLTGTGGRDYSLNNPGKYTKVTGVSVETAWGSNFYAASANSSTTAPTYVDVVNTIFKYGVRGVAGNTTVGGDLYVRLYGGTEWRDVAVLCTEWDTTVKGDLYMELNRWNLTYTGDTNSALGMRHSVLGVWGSNLEKKNTIVIKSGTFEGAVTSGICYANSTGNAIKGGSYLQIEGGTFKMHVVAGNTNITSGTATIENGTHLLIKGGTFNNNVYGGSYGSTGNVVDGGIDVFIDGGSFASPTAAGYGLYAAGARGKVIGDINLTINSDKVKFDITKGDYIISAGYHPNGSVDLNGVTSSTVTLANLTGASSLATNNQLKVMGGQQTSALVMNNVDTTIKAQLSQFSSILVTNGSDLTLTQATNASLGDASSVTIDSGSSLALDASGAWDLGGKTLSGEGILKKTGTGKLTIGDASGFNGSLNVQGGELSLSGGPTAKTLSGTGKLSKTGEGKLSVEDASGFTGTLNVQGGELHLDKATSATSLVMGEGTTLAVKEGDLFTGQGGSSISISGATLKADEGTWTLNKAATIAGATITGTGTHAVAFGSEVDETAVVTMSGTISTSESSQLILKNTAIATGTEATLSGNITFEGAVQNGGKLTIADGSTINVDKESLIRNAHFVNGTETTKGGNGFLADTSVNLAEGGTYGSLEGLKLTKTLDGKEVGLVLSTKTEGGSALVMSGLDEAFKNTYFVNDGTVSYTGIKSVAGTMGKTVNEIAIGNNGGAGSHQLILDSTWDNGVTITSASDHAQVSVSKNVVLEASKTAVSGAANEIHVTGEGTVLLNDTTKLSQIAGDATMKLSGDTTTFSTEAKMEGKLVVDGGQTLNLEDKASIASFSSVELGAESKLVSKQAGNDSIKSLSGPGDLSKTGAGKLTVKDASGFTGEINASAGTLELEKVALTGAKAPRKVSVSGGAAVNLVGMEEGVDGATIELKIDGGTFGVYSGTDAVESNVTGLTLAAGGKIVIGQNRGTLEANLTTLNGSTLDFASGGVLTMGCDLIVGDGTTIVISDAAYASLMDGKDITLFEGVDNEFCLDVTGYVICPTAAASAGGADSTKVYLQTGEGGVAMLSTTANTPEPTTGTLSLLALAGLCARRRRKH